MDASDENGFIKPGGDGEITSRWRLSYRVHLKCLGKLRERLQIKRKLHINICP
jgi:hypothetical protein